jgi:hypothetical protein
MKLFIMSFTTSFYHLLPLRAKTVHLEHPMRVFISVIHSHLEPKPYTLNTLWECSLLSLEVTVVMSEAQLSIGTHKVLVKNRPSNFIFQL